MPNKNQTEKDPWEYKEDEKKETAGGAKDSINNTADTTSDYDPSDIEKNKTVSGLAYLIFFLPLIVCPESKFGRFHANQALVLLLLSIIGNIIIGIFNAVPFIYGILSPLFGIFVFVLFIMGLVNGLNGKAKELPVIGSIKLI